MGDVINVSEDGNSEIEVRIGNEDYVDPSLFSPELSRHALDLAQRRARTLEDQLKEEYELYRKEMDQKRKALENSRLHRMYLRIRRLVRGGGNASSAIDYSLIDPSGCNETMDGDGGIELGLMVQEEEDSVLTEEEKSQVKPILRVKSNTQEKKTSASLRWSDDIQDVNDPQEEEDPVVQGRKRRRGMIRRLSAVEKHQLYQNRPDLQIVPNWPNKYRQEMLQDRVGYLASNQWMVLLVLFLVVVLIICIVMIFFNT